MKTVISYLRKHSEDKSLYSVSILIITLCSELVVIAGQRWGAPTAWQLYPMIGLFLSVYLSMIAWLYENHHFWPRSAIFTKLMANAIAPSWIGAIYLLVFIVHLGWLTDGSLNLFYSSNNTKEVAISLITGIFGTTAIISFFPDGRPSKKAVTRFAVISGISAPVKSRDGKYENLNLIPLVRILQLFKDKTDSICEMLILKTNSLDSKIIAPQFTDDQGFTELINNGIKEIENKEIKQSSQTLNEEIIRYIIKQTAIKEFPELYVWIEEKLTINFTDSCDYNNFSNCFKTLNRKISDLTDLRRTKIFFNITPGTVIVSSVMTLLSIDSKRELYYYKQTDDKSVAKEERLERVEKTDLPLENLLSQALENLKDSDD